MAKIISTPVELGFTDFVGKLISDTFDAIVTSQVSQEERWIELRELLGKSTEDFANEVVSDDVVEEYLTQVFPNDDGGHLIVAGSPYLPANSRRGVEEAPPIFKVLGYQPKSKKLSLVDVTEIIQIVRNEISTKQFEVLSALINKGNTRVLVDGGKINAKMTFNILQVDEEDDAANTGSTTGTSATGISSSMRSDLLFVKRPLSYASLAKPPALKNVHFFVKPTSDKDPQSTQVKANIYSEVEIHFKTIS